MPLQITGRHIDVTEEQRSYIEKKIGRLRRHFDQIDELAVIISVNRSEHNVEINFRAGTIHAFTKSTDPKPLAAIDKAIDKLEAQVAKAKDKRWGNKKHVGRRVPESTEES